ncbi:MAG: ABC transporter ATP-binding protein [Clostridia bacterium]|nr:ABC transporter ATP-binding protein [Clostridia bacterium]
MIELKGVSKQYLYGAQVLNALDMKIKDGEIVAVLGDEGSGKTTFVKVVSAVEDCDGEVLLDGNPMTQKTDDTIVVFDDLALFENRTFFYNLAFPLTIRGYDKQEISQRVFEAAEKMSIVACLGDKVKKASLIDKKRLAIARLLIRDAKAVFVDDITKGLSANEAQIILDALQPILTDFARRGASVVYSTTSREEARAIADRVVVLHYGEVKQIGAFDEIYAHPQNVWAGEAVDEFFAFEEATLQRADGKLQLTLDGVTLDASAFEGRVIESFVGGKVYLGWHGEDYAETGERTEDVKYSVRLSSGWLDVTESGRKVVSGQKLDKVCTLPNVNKSYLFDIENENSIEK